MGHKARRAQWPNFLASCQRVLTILHNAQWPNFPFAISGPPHRKFSLQLFLFPAPLPCFSHLSTFFWEYILPNINLVPFEIILMRVMNTWPHQYTQLIVSCAQCTPCKPSVVLSPLLTYDLCATGQNPWPLNKKCQVLLSLSDNICLSNDHIEQTQQFPLWIWIWSSTFLMELLPTAQ